MIMKQYKSPAKQSGIIIVLVLLIVSLMITLLAFMVEKQHLLVRRVGNQSVAEQGFYFAQGVNAWAERVLNDDVNRNVDHLEEDWGKFGRPEEEPQEDESFSLNLSSGNSAREAEEERATIDFGIEGLEYSIDDLQGRFNLNNLALKGPQLQDQKRIFINLLEVLEIGEFDQRERLYGALVDWIDENDLTSPNGFESGDYGTKKTPYYAADQLLGSLGELRFVEGFTEEVITKLSPYVSVLPVSSARINLNTTSAEVLASLSRSPVVDLGPVTAFLARRLEDGFQGFQGNDIQAAESAIIAVNPLRTTPITGMLQVNSQFYQINVKVVLGDYEYCMKTVVLRESATADGATTPGVSVLTREHDTLCAEPSQNTVLGDANTSGTET